MRRLAAFDRFRPGMAAAFTLSGHMGKQLKKLDETLQASAPQQIAAIKLDPLMTLWHILSSHHVLHITPDAFLLVQL